MIRSPIFSVLIILFLLNFIVIVPGFGSNVEPILDRGDALDISAAHQKVSSSHYESHTSISILGNSDFISQATSEGWAGDGSSSNPYVIDSLSITGSETLIKIHNTNLHFQIKNCLLSDGADGIYFYQVSNGRITDCTIKDNEQDGINLVESTTIYIEGNDIDNNNQRGIATHYSTNLTITNNTLSDNSWYGMDLRYSPNNRILDNEFSNNGFILRAAIDPADCVQTEVSGNTVNDLPLVYWQNKNGGTVPTDAGQIVLYNCQDVEVSDVTLPAGSAGITAVLCSNLNIHDNHITNNTAAGIYLWFASGNTIQDNDLENNGLFIIGLKVDDCVQDEVTGNTVNNKPLVYMQGEEEDIVPSGAGQIVLVDCDEIEIKDQVLEKTADGILLCFSSKIDIHDNYIINNIFPGIFVWISDRVDITSNLIADNKDTGIYFDGSYDLTIDSNTIKNNQYSGIYGGYQSDETTITKNIIADNLDDGIWLDYTSEGSIEHNVFEDNELYGLRLVSCEDFDVERNDFIDNNPDGDSQAFDGYNHGVENDFSHNYWDDWVTPDDDDGIVDDPYLIDGDSENSDPDPETNPNNPDLTPIIYKSRNGGVTPSLSVPLLITGVIFLTVFRRIIRRSKF